MKGQQPARKLPKKSQRPKRRYILFSLKQGSCANAKQAFDLVMHQFSLEQRKAFGIWFIEFSPENGRGIVRCGLKSVATVLNAIGAIQSEFQPKTLKTSGTLKTLLQKL